MLFRTFCHLPGVGPARERRWWGAGLQNWGHALAHGLRGPRRELWHEHLRTGQAAFERRDARHFFGCLPTPEHWRLFANFRPRAAYLDIETTGLGLPGDHVTTIALYDGHTVRYYVHGQNLAQFVTDVAAYDLLVTFNGKSFDLPFLRRQLGIALDHAHIDLLHLLRSVGYRGGLKAIERQLGLARPDMEDVDGYTAVLLWQEYRRTGAPEVLETLLAYNIQDVLNLEPLMVLAFNQKVAATPFADDLRQPEPVVAPNPCRASPAVLARVQPRTAFPGQAWRAAPAVTGGK